MGAVLKVVQSRMIHLDSDISNPCAYLTWKWLHVRRNCLVQDAVKHCREDIWYPPYLNPSRGRQYPNSKVISRSGVLTQCDVWNSPIPTANPKHRPGNMPAPVYPTCMVAVNEVLPSKVSQPAMLEGD